MWKFFDEKNIMDLIFIIIEWTSFPYYTQNTCILPKKKNK
jgi:hypothetical protein